MDRLQEFLAGKRPDDVVIFLADEHVDDPERLESHGRRVEGGLILVVPGDRGRQAFAAGTGLDPMNFARTAMDTDGEIAPDLTAGACPSTDIGRAHDIEFVFAFAEGQNEEVGGIYAEGDVIHAYARCACGTSYSDRWVVGDREPQG